MILHIHCQETPNRVTLQLSIRYSRSSSKHRSTQLPAPCLASQTMNSPFCFWPEPQLRVYSVIINSHSRFHTSNVDLLALDWVFNASGQDVLTSVFSIRARCLYSFNCIPKEPRETKQGNQGSLSARKKATSFHMPFLLTSFSTL